VSRPPAIPPSDKAKHILSILAGSTTVGEVAQVAGVTPQAVRKWRTQFIDAGIRALAADGQGTEADRRARELAQEIARLKIALGEAHMQLRVRRLHISLRRPRQREDPLRVTPDNPPAARSTRSIAKTWLREHTAHVHSIVVANPRQCRGGWWPASKAPTPCEPGAKWPRSRGPAGSQAALRACRHRTVAPIRRTEFW
jgi:transposase-like protein